MKIKEKSGLWVLIVFNTLMIIVNYVLLTTILNIIR